MKESKKDLDIERQVYVIIPRYSNINIKFVILFFTIAAFIFANGDFPHSRWVDLYCFCYFALSLKIAADKLAKVSS